MCTVGNQTVSIVAEIPQSSPPIYCTVFLGKVKFPCKGSSKHPVNVLASHTFSLSGSYRYELHMTHIVYGQSNKTVNVLVAGQCCFVNI